MVCFDRDDFLLRRQLHHVSVDNIAKDRWFRIRAAESSNQLHRPWYNRPQIMRNGYQTDHSAHNPRHTYSFHNPPTTQHRYAVSSQPPRLSYLSHHPLQLSKKCSRCAARCIWPVNHQPFARRGCNHMT